MFTETEILNLLTIGINISNDKEYINMEKLNEWIMQ